MCMPVYRLPRTSNITSEAISQSYTAGISQALAVAHFIVNVHYVQIIIICLDGSFSMALFYLQIQVMVDTARGSIQMSAATAHDQVLFFTASLQQGTGKAVAKQPGSHSSSSQITGMLSKLLSRPPTDDATASLIASMHGSESASDDDWACATALECSMQLACIGKLSQAAAPAAAAVGTAAAFKALQMQMSTAASQPQHITATVPSGSDMSGSRYSDQSLLTRQGTSSLEGLICKPVLLSTAVISLDAGDLLVAQQPPHSAATEGAMSGQPEQQPAVALHARFLAMDAQERRLAIQAQVHLHHVA